MTDSVADSVGLGGEAKIVDEDDFVCCLGGSACLWQCIVTMDGLQCGSRMLMTLGENVASVRWTKHAAKVLGIKCCKYLVDETCSECENSRGLFCVNEILCG